MTERDEPADDSPPVEWVPESVRGLVGDWLVDLYPRSDSTETDVE